MRLLAAAGLLAFIPGLCDKPEDPSKGVPPVVWNLRQAIEKEVTVEGKEERLTRENIWRVRWAAEDVMTFENIGNTDIYAETVYLLPRTWHWEHRQTVRDLLIFVGDKRLGALFKAEEVAAQEEGFRKQIFQAITKLHAEILPLGSPERVHRIVKEMKSPAWDDPKFGWKKDLLWRYAELVLVHEGASSVPPLAELLQPGQDRRPRALRALGRLGRPEAQPELVKFYGGGAATDEEAVKISAERAIRTVPSMEKVEFAVTNPWIDGDRAVATLEWEGKKVDVSLVRREQVWAVVEWR